MEINIVHDIFGKTTTKQFTLPYKTADHTDGEIICKWFSGSKLETGFFKIGTLKNKIIKIKCVI